MTAIKPIVVVDDARRLPDDGVLTMRQALLAVGSGPYRMAELVAAASAVLARPLWVLRPNGRRFLTAGSDPHPDVVPPAARVEAIWRDGRGATVDGRFVSVSGVTRPEVVVVADVIGHDTGVTIAILDEAALAFGYEALRLRSVAEGEMVLGGGLAHEILRPDDPARLHWIADALDYDLERPHRAVVCAPSDGNRAGGDLVSAVTVAANVFDAGSLVFYSDGTVVLLATADVDWNDFLASVEEGAGQTCCLGLGDWKREIADLNVSYAEGGLALRLRGFAGRRVSSFADLGSYGLLASLDASPMLDDFIDGSVGAIVRYDDAKGAELMPTLQTYLASGANVTATARSLHVHRNTLKYRLARIHELCGLDPDDPADRFNLQLATGMWAVRQASAELSEPVPRPSSRP